MTSRSVMTRWVLLSLGVACAAVPYAAVARAQPSDGPMADPLPLEEPDAPATDVEPTGDEGDVEPVEETEADESHETLVAPDWDESADHPATLQRSTEEGPASGRAEPTASRRNDSNPAALAYRPFLLELGGLAGLNYHQLTYRDDLYGFMRPYRVSNAKSFGGYLEAYPLAVAVGGVLGRLGLEGRYWHMVGFDSIRADGSRFPTSARELILGLRYRLLPEALQARGMQLTFGLGGGFQTFDVDSALALQDLDNLSEIPARDYRFLRADVGGRFALDLGFFITLHAGLRVVFDAGEIDSREWFPNARAMGIESGMHLGYVLPKNLEVQIGFEAQRYFYDLRPDPDDGNYYEVGGALDRYVLVDVRFGWRY